MDRDQVMNVLRTMESDLAHNIKQLDCAAIGCAAHRDELRSRLLRLCIRLTGYTKSLLDEVQS